MLHHRTIDPAERAADIATREASLACRNGEGRTDWYEIWKEVYDASLRELVGEVNLVTAE